VIAIVDPPTLRANSPAVEVLTLAVGLALAACLAYALRLSLQQRNPVPVLLVIGGFLAIWNEPIVDVLSNIYFVPKFATVETLGRPMPLWAPLMYGVYYGFGALAMYELARRGLTGKTFWAIIGSFFAAQVVLEVFLLHLDIYVYYGDQPFRFLGLPLYWLFINPPGILGAAALLLRKPTWFAGRRAPLILLVLPTTVAAGSLATGWPVFSALQRPAEASGLFAWLGAGTTMLLSAWMIARLAELLCTPGSRDEQGTPATTQPAVSGTRG
jgi:hypothetical protein